MEMIWHRVLEQMRTSKAISKEGGESIATAKVRPKWRRGGSWLTPIIDFLMLGGRRTRREEMDCSIYMQK